MDNFGYWREKEQLPLKIGVTALVYIAFTKYGVTEVYSHFDPSYG